MKIYRIVLAILTIVAVLLLMHVSQERNKEKMAEIHYSEVVFHKMNSGRFVEYSPPGHYIVKISLPEFGSDTIHLRVSESTINARTNLTNYVKKNLQRAKTKEGPD